jgi:hypothetical protein
MSHVFNPKLRILKFNFCVCIDFLSFLKKNRHTKTSGVDSGIFCYRNFGSANKHKVSVERKPKKLSKFRAKINHCVLQLFLRFKINSILTHNFELDKFVLEFSAPETSLSKISSSKNVHTSLETSY